ncbi:MAG TPA: DoxX family protein [Candidatus Acidoferrales bacterium]|nr:DoxX family protein [Candidatus Acidoferrales bacterium]
MEATIDYSATARRSHGRGAVWTGRIITGIVVLFMLFDSITKILKVDAVVKASAQLGYSANTIMAVGIILFACLVVYLYPRTAILGAVLLTGYLGGAVEANLRVGTPLFSNILFPVYFGILVWAGLYLRNSRVREFLSFRKAE